MKRNGRYIWQTRWNAAERSDVVGSWTWLQLFSFPFFENDCGSSLCDWVDGVRDKTSKEKGEKWRVKNARRERSTANNKWFIEISEVISMNKRTIVMKNERTSKLFDSTLELTPVISLDQSENNTRPSRSMTSFFLLMSAWKCCQYDRDVYALQCDHHGSRNCGVARAVFRSNREAWSASWVL